MRVIKKIILRVKDIREGKKMKRFREREIKEEGERKRGGDR